MNRPTRLVGVLGTATEVGKTWTTAALVTDLRRRGISVGARKPVQSHDPDDGAPTDSEVLAAAADCAPGEVSPEHRTLPVPMAPPMAAAVLGLQAPTVAELVAEIQWPDRLDVGLLETVGGVLSPVAVDGHSLDLVVQAGCDAALLVADAGLGTIDAVRTALHVISGRDVDAYVLLNRFDPTDDLHVRNAAWLREVDGIDAVVDVASLTTRLLSHGD